MKGHVCESSDCFVSVDLTEPDDIPRASLEN